jgi:hypothetical protein
MCDLYTAVMLICAQCNELSAWQVLFLHWSPTNWSCYSQWFVYQLPIWNHLPSAASLKSLTLSSQFEVTYPQLPIWSHLSSAPNLKSLILRSQSEVTLSSQSEVMYPQLPIWSHPQLPIWSHLPSASNLKSLTLSSSVLSMHTRLLLACPVTASGRPLFSCLKLTNTYVWENPDVFRYPG